MTYVLCYLSRGSLWFCLTGIAFIFAGIAFLLHRQVRLTEHLLALLLTNFLVAIPIPNYIHVADLEMKKMEFVSIKKVAAVAAWHCTLTVTLKT